MADEDEIDYADEFSDTETESPVKAVPPSGGDDEQTTQRKNGQMESLKQRVEELELELKAEKKAHASTKSALTKAEARAESSDGKRAQRDESKGQEEGEASSSGSSSSQWVTQMTLFALTNELKVASGLGEDEQLTEIQAYESMGEITDAYKSARRDAREAQRKLKDNTEMLAGDDKLVMGRIKSLEDELRLALGAAEDIRALKAKMMQLIERIRVEKESRHRLDQENKQNKRKMEMLSDHIEKLMTHLKHEAAAKIRALEQLRASEKETLKMKTKAALIHRKSVAKDRFLIELREGSKILEDQLRLMDEKYLELRAKLDFARESGAKKVKRAERLAADLRVKYALAGGTGTLDNIPLPSIYGGSTASTTEMDEMSMSMTLATGSVTGGSVKGGSSKGKKKVKIGAATAPGGKGGPDIDSVIEKIRLKTGGVPEWTEDRLKSLTASR